MTVLYASAPMIEYGITAARADQLLRRRGRLCALRRRGAPDRYAYAAVTEFNPQERTGKLSNPQNRKVILSSLANDGSILLPPESEFDRFLTLVRGTFDTEEAHKIIMPAKRYAPNGIVIYWKLAVLNLEYQSQ